MTLTLITPPASEPLPLASAKEHLQVYSDDDDAVIGAMITAARKHTEDKLGRSLLATTWRAVWDRFPCGTHRDGGLKLLRCPVSSVTSVKYVATDGTLTTLDADDYQLVVDSEPGLIVPAYGTSWPSTRCEPGAVRVEFVAGYASASDVPADVIAYIKLLLGSMYEHRETELTGTILTEVKWAERLLDNERVY